MNRGITYCGSPDSSCISNYDSLLIPEDPMLRIATAILIILWLLGLATGLTLSSFIHVLPVLAIVIELIRIDESEDDAFAAGPKTEE